MRKRTLIICLSVLALAGLGGGAYAATRSSQAPTLVPAQIVGVEHSFIKDAAKRLHVTPARLTAALKGAAVDQVNAQVKAGHLTAAQASAIKERLAHGFGLPFGPLAFAAPILPPPLAFGRVTKAPGFFGPPAVLPAAAKYLGLSASALVKQLKSGKSLAQIATARGKSTSGLEQALIAYFKPFFQRPFAAGHIPAAMEQKLEAALRKWVQTVVTTRGTAGRPFALSLPVPPPTNARIHPPPTNARIQVLPGYARGQAPVPGSVIIRSAGGPPFWQWMMGAPPPPGARLKAAPPGR